VLARSKSLFSFWCGDVEGILYTKQFELPCNQMEDWCGKDIKNNTLLCHFCCISINMILHPNQLSQNMGLSVCQDTQHHSVAEHVLKIFLQLLFILQSQKVLIPANS